MRSTQRKAGSATRSTPAHAGLTLLACTLVTAAFGMALAQLTAGFEHWTFEARRRHDAASGRVTFPAMHLVDAAGRGWQLPAGGTGQVMMVTFIYTSCPTVCQSLGAEFHQAQQRIHEAGSSIRLVSVSVDPVRDTASALAHYARLHRSDGSIWRMAAPVSVAEGLTARRALGIIAIDDGSGGFVHNGATHVVDQQGRVRGIFDTTDWERALARARELEAAAP